MAPARLLLGKLALCLWLGGLATPVAATQLALVDRDVGHALLFQHRGNCFALLPSHVARSDRFSLALPLQNVVGAGTAFLRDTANDLAIAYVEGDVSAFCTDLWTGFDRDLRSVLENATSGQIVRLGSEGVQDRTEAQIVAVTPERVVVRTTDALADGQIYQGSSGSVLEIAGRVVGIAQSALSGREAQFFRMDEILRRAGPEMGAGLALRHPADAARAAMEAPGGFRVTGWSGAGQGTDAAVLEPGLLSGAFVTPWQGDPVVIEITLDPQQPVALNLVRLRSDPGAAPDQSPPKSILFEVDAGGPDRPFWRNVGLRDMPPSGAIEFRTGGIFARRLRITLKSVWFADRPQLRLDGIEVE